MTDQHFRMSEMDGGVYDTQHLFLLKMKGEKLQEFITTWGQVLARLAKGPGDATLQALVLRTLRRCKTMEHRPTPVARLLGYGRKTEQPLYSCLLSLRWGNP